MLYHDMLPRITTAPTPIPTFCHVFIALASRPSPYGWAVRSLIHTSGRARMFPGLDESEEIRRVPIYRFSEFHASLRLRARVTVPTHCERPSSARSQVRSVWVRACWSILDAFK